MSRPALTGYEHRELLASAALASSLPRSTSGG